MSLESIKKKCDKVWKKPVIFLFVIGIISLLIRLYYLPNYPLTLDSLDYFFYATDIKINNEIPLNYTPANNGWPIFLSLFFSLATFEDTFSYMQLQRIISIVISILTIIPIYYLSKKFFDSKLAIIGATIFAFEPRLIQNSLLGITDALYIFLISITLVTFLGSKKSMYLSFVFASFATLVRSEGIVLLFVISILFFVKFKDQKKEFPKFIFAIGIMVLILLPMMTFKTEITGNDLIFGRAITAVSTFDQYMQEGNENGGNPFLTGVEFFSKFLVWSMVPIFGFFVPIGIFIIIRKIDFKKIFLIIGIIGFSVPAFWAYTLPLQDSRYLFFMYPFFIIISLFTIQKINRKKFSNIVLFVIIGGTLLSSCIFLYYTIDNKHEEESYIIAKILSDEIKSTNYLYPESKFFEVVTYPTEWSEFSKFFKKDRIQGISIRHNVPESVTLFDSNEFNNLNELIDFSNNKITHIIIDESNKRESYLNKIFKDETKVNYLKKNFDSLEEGFDYHIKSFVIDYQKFYDLKN